MSDFDDEGTPVPFASMAGDRQIPLIRLELT